MNVRIIESARIPGVLSVELRPFADDRGRFLETFRRSWFPQRDWTAIQTNRSDSAAGVIRGLHFHFRQVDYWVVVQGLIRAALVDVRPDSPAFGQAETIALSGEVPLGLYIPVGVAHGFAAHTAATLTYVVDNYYDSSDEHGIAWNDPDLAIDWGVDEPLLSTRDAANPFLADIAPNNLPHLRHSR